MKAKNFIIIFAALLGLIFLNQGVSLAKDDKYDRLRKIRLIRDLAIFEKNTDENPKMDSLEIYVVFGSKKARTIKPYSGTEMGYSCKVYAYENDIQTDELTAKNGVLVTTDGLGPFTVRLPDMQNKIKVLVDVTVILPNGTPANFKKSTTFDPKKY